MDNIIELKDMLMGELSQYGTKVDLSTGDLDVIDKLAHSVKNLCKIIDRGDPSRRGRHARTGWTMPARNDEFVEHMQKLMDEAPN